MGTDIDYSTVAHQTIVTNITQGSGAGPLMDASQECQGIATELQAVQGLVEQAVRGIGVAQQGAAADAATHATMVLIPWATDAVTAANQMAARISEQAASFVYTRDNMPLLRAVPEVSFSQDPGTWMADHAVEWLPGIQTDHERAQVAAQQDEQRARDLMHGYQANSNDNLATDVRFTPAPTVVAEVTDPIPASGGVSGGWSGHPSSPHAGPGAGGHGGAVAPVATASQLASSVHPVPAPATTSPQVAGGHPDHGGQSIPGPSHLRPAAAFEAPPTTGLSGAAGGSDRLRRGSGAGTGSGRTASVSHGGAFGPRPSSRPVSETSRMTGHPEPGSGRNGLPESAHGGRSGAGFGNVPLGAAGGQGRGDGDIEHQRPSYLVEQDTNAIVGDLPRTAPAVIGADEGYR